MRRNNFSSNNLLRLIGDTPLIELKNISPSKNIRIFAKLEGQNPSGSIKDRVTLGLVRIAAAQGKLKPGDTIVEATSGNTGISLAMIAKQLGYRVQVMVPKEVPVTIKDVLKLFGADITWCSPSVGMKGAIDLAQEMADDKGYYPLRQFEDSNNVDIHYNTTGVEIVSELDRIDVFVSGIGTGGTITGVAKRLREINPKLKVIGVEPKLGDRLQGLRNIEEGYTPPLLNLSDLDGRFIVDTAQAIEKTRIIAEKEGIIAGVSSGATLSAALRVAEKMTKGNIVVMFSDAGWKYLPSRPWSAARKNDPMLSESHWW